MSQDQDHDYEFHDDAHPEATEITGNSSGYSGWGQCVASKNKVDERCKAVALGPHGKCRNHGGESPTADENPKVGRGDQEGNVNGATHGLHVELNSYYKNIMDDRERELCDDIYTDYLSRYRDNNGEPIAGEKARMFEIAVNHIKVIHSDNWAMDKPTELRSGSPMVDAETKQSEGGEYTEYKESVVIAGQLKLRREDRAWLKDHNMMNDPQSQTAESVGSFMQAIKEASDE